jgi:hypothetical protein
MDIGLEKARQVTAKFASVWNTQKHILTPSFLLGFILRDILMILSHPGGFLLLIYALLTFIVFGVFIWREYRVAKRKRQLALLKKLHNSVPRA